jgi:hypothetical protein
MSRLTLLCSTEQCPILLSPMSTPIAGEKLHDHSRSGNWADSEFHEGAAVRCEDEKHPIERVRQVGRQDTV